MGGDSEYEPRDSRNITGTASTPDGRWTKPDARVPRDDGRPGEVAPQDSPPPAPAPGDRNLARKTGGDRPVRLPE